MVELAPAAVIAVACAVAIVSIFACGYQYALMRADRKQAEAPLYVPRHAKQDQTPSAELINVRGTVKVFGDTDTSRFTREFRVPVGAAA